MAKPPAVRAPNAHQMMMNRMTPTMAIVRYWRLRYALAPAWMAAAISCIRGLPAGFARIVLIQ